MVRAMQDNCLQDDAESISLSRRSALKAGGFMFGLLSFGRFAGLAEAKAAGGSGLVRAEDYGLGAPFDDLVRFQFVRELEEDVKIHDEEYPKSIEYWIGCESVGGPEAAKKTFQGYLIEDDTGDNGMGGNQSVMYIYEKRPVSFDWHVFVEDEACGEEYVKVGYEPGEDGAAPDDPGNRPPDKGGDGDDGDHDDGDHEDSDTASDDGSGESGDDGGAGDDKGQGSDGSAKNGGEDSGKGGSDGNSGFLKNLFAWFANFF